MLSRGKKSSDFQFKTVRFFIEFRFELFMFVHVSFRHDSNKLQSIFFCIHCTIFSCLSLVVFLLFLYFSTVWWLTFWWYITRWIWRRYEFVALIFFAIHLVYTHLSLSFRKMCLTINILQSEYYLMKRELYAFSFGLYSVLIFINWLWHILLALNLPAVSQTHTYDFNSWNQRKDKCKLENLNKNTNTNTNTEHTYMYK